MRARRSRSSLILCCVVASVAVVFTAAPTSAEPTWAPAATASIHPGAETVTGGGQCTANFVFYDDVDVYLGQAAHCSGTGGATATDGCTSESLPLGTQVTVDGASQPGTLVYNSWIEMQANGETDPDTCQFNDLALVRLHPDDRDDVNPSIPHWGGPVGLATSGTAIGDRVYSYGNSSLRFGLDVLKPKTGISVGDAGNGWSHNVYTVTPGIPGDSGSAFLDPNGNALGVLSTLQVAPLVGSNGVGDVALELQYLNDTTGLDVELALGTEPFDGSQLPLG